MKKYIISYDVRLPGIIEVEAKCLDEAIEKVFAMKPSALLMLANEDSTELMHTSVNVEDEYEDE